MIAEVVKRHGSNPSLFTTSTESNYSLWCSTPCNSGTLLGFFYRCSLKFQYTYYSSPPATQYSYHLEVSRTRKASHARTRGTFKISHRVYFWDKTLTSCGYIPSWGTPCSAKKKWAMNRPSVHRGLTAELM